MKRKSLIAFLIIGLAAFALPAAAQNRGNGVFFVWYGDLSGSNPATPVIGELVASLGGSSYLLLQQNWMSDRSGRCALSYPQGCALSQGDLR